MRILHHRPSIFGYPYGHGNPQMIKLSWEPTSYELQSELLVLLEEALLCGLVWASDPGNGTVERLEHGMKPLKPPSHPKPVSTGRWQKTWVPSSLLFSSVATDVVGQVRHTCPTEFCQRPKQYAELPFLSSKSCPREARAWSRHPQNMSAMDEVGQSGRKWKKVGPRATWKMKENEKGERKWDKNKIGPNERKWKN